MCFRRGHPGARIRGVVTNNSGEDRIACRLTPVRIGTWNLAGRWDPRHRDFLLALNCDVLLLTEVNERLHLPDYDCHLTTALMAPRRHWAGIVSRLTIEPLADPHPASAMASIESTTFCSSILPWKAAPSRSPWAGDGHAEKVQSAVATLLPQLPRTELIWGGDWNHALTGREYAGSQGGRRHLVAALEGLELRVPTASLAHRIDGLLAIDHIGVGPTMNVAAARRHVAVTDGQRLSDHDAYVIELS